MAEFTPVRMVNKNGDTAIAQSPKAFKTLKFSSGYRVAEDQTNLEGPELDNGQLVEPGAPVVAGAVVAEDTVVAGSETKTPEAVQPLEGVVVDAPATEGFDEVTPVDEAAPAVESASASKSSSRKR